MGWQDDPVVSGWQSDPVVEEPEASRFMALMGGVNRGIAGLLGLPVDTGENLINLGLTGYGAAKNAITGRADTPPQLTGSFLGSEHIANLMERGLNAQTTNPSPQDAPSRLLNTAGQIAGGSIVPGARIPSTLAAAGGGAIAGEVGGPQYTGLGALTPAATKAGTTATRQALTQNVANNLQVFQRAGVSPSVGLSTDNVFFNGVENLISKFPGGAGTMTTFRENLQRNLGSKVKTGVSAEEAGRAIERGITGPKGFLETTKRDWIALDQAVANKVPKNTTIIPSNTAKALGELTTPVQGAERTTAGLVNPKLSKMASDLADDLQANQGRIPFEAIRSLRTKVGSMTEMVDGVPGGELKKLYGALSADLEEAARAGGAAREFARQNQYYAARMGRIERVLERVLGKDKLPEDIFKTFYPTDSTQANKVRATIRSLPADERKIVSQAVVDRLGRATPGRQNELGDIFSSETFLTNWDRLSPGAKSVLFPDSTMRANLDAVAAASSKIRHGSSIFSNPSGTAGSFAAYSIYSSPIVSLATGSPSPMLAAAGAAGTARITARMMTDPRVVRWMAHAPQGDPQRLVAHLARLANVYNSIDDEALKADLADYIRSMNGE